MLITRKSIWSNKERTLDIPVTEEQIDAWESGTLIQKAMPHLTPSEREFLITGMTDEEWNEMNAEDKEDEGEEPELF